MEEDKIIQSNPRILEDEPEYPDIKKVFRDHHKKKSNGRVRWKDYIPVPVSTWEEYRERKWIEHECNEYKSYMYDAEEGLADAMWNID